MAAAAVAVAAERVAAAMGADCPVVARVKATPVDEAVRVVGSAAVGSAAAAAKKEGGVEADSMAVAAAMLAALAVVASVVGHLAGRSSQPSGNLRHLLRLRSRSKA